MSTRVTARENGDRGENGEGYREEWAERVTGVGMPSGMGGMGGWTSEQAASDYEVTKAERIQIGE